MEKLKWWGYVHQNGTFQLKRYFSIIDLDEARESPFVDKVYGPWEVETREEAVDMLRQENDGEAAEPSHWMPLTKAPS